jgi:hypothetical protein
MTPATYFHVCETVKPGALPAVIVDKVPHGLVTCANWFGLCPNMRGPKQDDPGTAVTARGPANV